MYKNIIEFYNSINALKHQLRTGWEEVGISADRLESVAEHVFGTAMLAFAINEEEKLGLDMLKVYEIIMIKEIAKVNLNQEYTTNSNVSYAEAAEQGRKTILDVTKALSCARKVEELLKEAQEKSTKEADFAFKVAKFESDLQAKKYDTDGQFDLDKALADVKNYGPGLTEKILPQVNNASDGWLLYDRQHYVGDELFEGLSRELQNFSDRK